MDAMESVSWGVGQGRADRRSPTTFNLSFNPER